MRESRWLTGRSIAEQVNIDKETGRKILTADLDMRKCVCKNDPKGSDPTALAVREFLATKQITLLKQNAYSTDLAPKDFSVPENKGNFERKAF